MLLNNQYLDNKMTRCGKKIFLSFNLKLYYITYYILNSYNTYYYVHYIMKINHLYHLI